MLFRHASENDDEAELDAKIASLKAELAKEVRINKICKTFFSYFYLFELVTAEQT